MDQWGRSLAQNLILHAHTVQLLPTVPKLGMQARDQCSQFAVAGVTKHEHQPCPTG
jgi:hypothetical protein